MIYVYTYTLCRKSSFDLFFVPGRSGHLVLKESFLGSRSKAGWGWSRSLLRHGMMLSLLSRTLPEVLRLYFAASYLPLA